MLEHHERAIARLTAALRDDPRYLALIIGGSLAKGRARPDSDVDVLIVATDEEAAARRAAGDIQYFNREVTDWPGGYAEGKIIDAQFLRDVAERGSEPARAAFTGAVIAFSRLPGLADLLARIPVYPEAERAERMASFYAQVIIHTWYVGEAEKRQDAYLRTWAAGQLVLFGGRLIMAYNRHLFPYHKWFMYELREIPDKPADFMERAEALLAAPTLATAEAFRDSLEGFADWGLPRRLAPARFMWDSEWNWRTGHQPPTDW
jgi:hypothetical protein